MNHVPVTGGLVHISDYYLYLKYSIINSKWRREAEGSALIQHML